MTKAPKVLSAAYGSPENPLELGGAEIQCYVLENGTRVLSGRGMQGALGLGQAHGTRLARFLGDKRIKPFIDNDLAMALKDPIRFIRPGRGGVAAIGYEATILPDICGAVLKARKLGTLSPQGLLVAEQCEILLGAFSKVGIIALVDEVTGYQEVRSRKALERILEEFVTKELRKWAKTFPDDFYIEMFRLRKWQYMPFSVKRPAYVGKLTNDLVYERVAPGVLGELKRKNPKDERGRRKNRHHQWLTEDVGHPRLREHLAAVIALMKASTTWGRFHRSLERVFPKPGETADLFPDMEDS